MLMEIVVCNKCGSPIEGNPKWIDDMSVCDACFEEFMIGEE